MEKKVEQACHQKVLRRVARLFSQIGLARTKTTFFTRRNDFVTEFIHIHKYSFTPGYRIHLGIRGMNDTFSDIALNGPDSHASTCPGGTNGQQYDFEFNSDESSIIYCANEIYDWCRKVGLPWFERFQNAQSLLSKSDSPLSNEAMSRLRLALHGQSDPEIVEVSEALLGVGRSS